MNTASYLYLVAVYVARHEYAHLLIQLMWTVNMINTDAIITCLFGFAAIFIPYPLEEGGE